MSDPLRRRRDFRRLWLAQAVSAFGARITREGLPIAAVLSLSASPAQTGLLTALSTGPALLVGLAAGGWVDRTRRRGLMIGADLARALILTTIPVAALLHLLTLPHLYLAAACVGAASVLFEIADHAYLPTLVDRDELTRANASLSVTEAVAEVGGPAIGGVLFQAFAGPLAIGANALTYLLSAVLLGAIRTPEPAPRPEPQARWRDDVRLGFERVWRAPLLRALLLISAGQGFFGGIFGALYVIFCLRTLGLSPGLLGLTIACGGAGALAGAALAAPLSRRLGPGPAILAAGVVTALATGLIPLAPATPLAGAGVLMVAQVVGDATATAGMILAASLRQTVLPQAVLGRVGATFKAAAGTCAIAGALAGGVLAEAAGVRPVLALAAAGLLSVPLLALVSPLRRP